MSIVCGLILHRKIAKDTGGVFKHINDGDANLAMEMASFYMYFAFGLQETANDLYVTSPYTWRGFEVCVKCCLLATHL